MALMASARLIKDALANRYAVPHFSVFNLETVLAVAAAADERRSPVVFGVGPGELAYAGRENLVAIISAAIRSRDLVAAIHLDCCPSFEDAVRGLRAGYGSVTFDGSGMSQEESIRTAARITEVARPIGVSVEAFVGTIDKRSDYGNVPEHWHVTQPSVCEAMAATGIDAMVLSAGNASGPGSDEPHLDLELLSEIRQRTDLPFVLNARRLGISDDEVRKAIGLGVAQFNMGAAIQGAFRRGILEGLADDPESHDALSIMERAQARIKEAVGECIDTVLSAGRGR